MDWQAAGVISNIILVSVLVFITAYYAWQVKKQTDQMEKNRRMERLQREMNDLIGPLYSRRSSYYFNDVQLSWLTRDQPESWGAREFWMDIKKNLYLIPKTTCDEIRRFIEFKLGERDIGGSKDTYTDWLKKITDAVTDRYKELTQELEGMKND